MSRRLTTLFLSMLILTGAMGLKTLVVAQDHDVMMANGPAIPPPPPSGYLNGPAIPPPPPSGYLNGPAIPPPPPSGRASR